MDIANIDVLTAGRKELNALEEQSTNTTRATDILAASLGRMNIPATVLTAAISGLSKVVSITAEYESLEASLRTITGSAHNAGVVMDMLSRMASQTPLNIDELTSSFVKLKVMGLNPSQEALISYGNTSTAVGASLGQMIEAVVGASKGEFEMLEQFGIFAQSEGDRIKFTFQGVTTEVGKNSADIQRYLMDIGNTQFVDAMANRMDTLDGDLKKMNSSWSDAALILGETFNPALRLATQFLSYIGRLAQVAAIEFKDLGNLLGSYMAQVEAVASLDFDRAFAIGEMRKNERLEIDKTIDAILDQRTEYEKLADAEEKLKRIKGDLSLTAQATRRDLVKEIELRTQNIEKLEAEAKATSEHQQKPAVRSFFESDVVPSDEAKAIINSLKEQVETWGMTADQITKRKIGLTGDVEAMKEAIPIIEKLNELRDADAKKKQDDKDKDDAKLKADQQANQLNQLQQYLDKEAEMFATSQLNEEQRLGLAYAKRAEMIYQAYDNGVIPDEDRRDALLMEQAELFQQQFAVLQEQNAILLEQEELYHQQRQKLKEDADNSFLNQTLFGYESIRAFGKAYREDDINAMRQHGLATLQAMGQHSKTAFEIYKKAAIANAVVAAYQGISKTLGEYPFPLNAVMAAAHGVMAFAQIRSIQAQKFGGNGGGGSSISSGGSAPSVQSQSAPSLPQQKPAQPQQQFSLIVLGDRNGVDIDGIFDQVASLINDGDRELLDVNSRNVQNIIEAVKA